RSNSCFALETKVQLANGKLVEMVELQISDLVSSDVKNNWFDMVKIKFTNPDRSKGYVRMTPSHCVFSSDLSLLYALDVVLGETKILVTTFNGLGIRTNSTHCQNELHPYVQYLETTNIIWCKALEGIKIIEQKDDK
ncbi:107_t:CDS:2, partial [Racocetra persica]